MISLICFFIVTLFFGEIVTTQNVITKDSSSPKNDVLSQLFYDYEKMLNDLKIKEDILETGIKIQFSKSKRIIKPRGYNLLKIIEEHYFTDEDELVEYMEKLYEYFNNLATTQIEDLKKHIESISKKRQLFSDGTRDLQKVQTTIPEGELNDLYAKYNIEETKRNVNNLVYKIRETLKENLKILKQEVKLIEKFLLIKQLPLYFEELFKEFKKYEVALKPTFDKIKKLSEDMKKENIDEHKRREDEEVTKLENVFKEEYKKTEEYVKDTASTESIQDVDPPLSADSPVIQQPTDNKQTGDQHVNPTNIPSHATDDLQHLKKNGDSPDQHTNKKGHHTKISELLEKYKDKIGATSFKITSSGKSTEDGKTHVDVNAVNILKLIEIIKDNEQELTEVTKDLETLVTEMQNEKESMDKMYSKLARTRSGADNTEAAANAALAEKAVQEYLKLKKEAEFYLEKLYGKSRNSLNNAKNGMNFTIQNIIAVLVITIFLF